MKKLYQLVDIIDNNVSAITLKIKDDCKLDLITLGFDPSLEYIYLSKGKNHVMKLINRDNKVTSFSFGENGCTIISNGLEENKEKILNCITDDFGIAYYGKPNELEKTSYIKTVNDKFDIDFNIQLQWFNEDHISMHRDNFYFKSFNSLSMAKKYITDNYYIYEELPLRLSKQTNCKILEFNCHGKQKEMEFELQ